MLGTCNSCAQRASVVTTLLSMVPPCKGCGWQITMNAAVPRAAGTSTTAAMSPGRPRDCGRCSGRRGDHGVRPTCASRNPQRSGIDAVAQTGGLRTIVEHVAQVGVTGGAGDLGAGHAMGVVAVRCGCALPASGSQKLGQPQPASNFFSDSNRSVLHTTQ